MKLRLLFSPQNRPLNADLTSPAHGKWLSVTLLSKHIATEPLLPCLQSTAFAPQVTEPFQKPR